MGGLDLVSMASLPAYVKMKRVLGLEEVQLDQLGHLTGACLVCLEPLMQHWPGERGRYRGEGISVAWSN